MVSARFLTTRISRYYRVRGYEVKREVKLGNCIIDLAAARPETGEKVAIEGEGVRRRPYPRLRAAG
ncbi:MAG: hypothetical protein QW057_10275 [Candidatus Bathyarchaeia archaeon]